MKIGDEVYVHGYVDEIRNDVVIIRNDGGYFGTIEREIFAYEEDERGYGTMNEADRKTEPTISKMEQVEEPQMGDAKPIPLSNRVTHIKDEPKTQMKTQNSNLTFEKVMEEIQTQVIEFPDTHQKFVFARKIEMDGDSIKICGWEYKGVKDGEREGE